MATDVFGGRDFAVRPAVSNGFYQRPDAEARPPFEELPPIGGEGKIVVADAAKDEIVDAIPHVPIGRGAGADKLVPEKLGPD